MKKKILGLALAGTLVLSQPILAALNIKIHLNGQELKTDVAPEVKAERTFVPLRFISEGLGYQVDWKQKDLQVDISKKDQSMSLWIDKNTIKVNGKTKVMDVAPYAKNNRTLVPIRFVAENLGAKVDWDQEKKLVLITSEDEGREKAASFLEGVDLSKLTSEERAYVEAFDKDQQVLVQTLKDFRNLAFRDFNSYNKMDLAKKMSQTGLKATSAATSIEKRTPPDKFKASHENFVKLSRALPGMVEDYKAAFLADDKDAAINLTSKMTDFSVLTRQIVDQVKAEIKGEAFVPKEDVDAFLKTKDDRLFMDSTLKNLLNKIRND